MKTKSFIIGYSLLFFTPMLVFAAPTFRDLVGDVYGLISRVSVLVMALAVVFFFWGLARFVFSAGDQKALESGRNIMVWGSFALFALFSIWGLVSILSDAFGL